MKNFLKIIFTLGIFIIFPLKFSLASSDELTLINIVRSANDFRQQHGQQPLIINEKLTRTAVDKALDMERQQYFSHLDPQNNDFSKWLKKDNYQYYYAGENLALDFYQRTPLMSAWERSPKHRANLLDPIFQETGVTILKTIYKNQPTIFIVQMFGADPYKVYQPYFPSLVPIISTNPATNELAWLPSPIGNNSLSIFLSDSSKTYYLWDIPYRQRLSVQASDTDQTFWFNKIPTGPITYQQESFLDNIYYYISNHGFSVWIMIIAIVTLISSQKMREEK